MVVLEIPNRSAARRCEMNYQDETHLETNPYLGRVWYRVGEQPVLPAVAANRRVTVLTDHVWSLLEWLSFPTIQQT